MKTHNGLHLLMPIAAYVYAVEPEDKQYVSRGNRPTRLNNRIQNASTRFFHN